MNITKSLKTITQCRVCGNKKLIPCIDIGAQYLSSIFPTDLNYKKDLKPIPLDIVLCEKEDGRGGYRDEHCGLLQLVHENDLSEMYNHYPYTSSSNTSMNKILQDVAESGKALGLLEPGDLICDIGCNDGTLLNFFTDKDNSYDLLGIDPARNIKSNVQSTRFHRVTNYFTAQNFENATEGKACKKAKLIFSVAMFYHLSDPVTFARDIEKSLADDGVAIIQMAYLPAMIKTNMYDNIVHEHVGYYGTHHMKWIMERVGLEIFDVLENDVYGGSFRVFLKKKNNTQLKATPRLKKNLEAEMEWGIYKTQTYLNYMKSIEKTKKDLLELCKQIKKEGKSIWVYGASTKGNTIMQYCGIGPETVDAAADSNSFKFNKYLIGSDIPIRDEAALRAAKPDYLLALPYSFVEGFKKRETELVAGGTRFIVPLPQVHVV